MINDDIQKYHDVASVGQQLIYAKNARLASGVVSVLTAMIALVMVCKRLVKESARDAEKGAADD